MKYDIWSYKVESCWIRCQHRTHYGTHFMAQITGPFLGHRYFAISRTLPGAIAKLANIMRKQDIGRLHPGCERSDAIMGLNRWWGE